MPKSIFAILITLILVISGVGFQKLFLGSVPDLVETTSIASSSKITDLYPDLQNFNNCNSQDNKVIILKEFDFSTIKFLVIGNEKGCSTYNYYTNIVKVMPDKSLKVVEKGCGNSSQEKILESPNKKYLLLNNGCHSGACYHTNGFSVYDIVNDKIIFTNLIDNDGRNHYKDSNNLSKGLVYDWQTTENISWTTDSKVNYDETLLLEGACRSVKDGETLDSATPSLVSKKTNLSFDPELDK